MLVISKIRHFLPPKLLVAAFGIAVALRVALEPSSFMPAAVSVVLLAATLWVICSPRYIPTDRHWAYAMIGTVVGFWLHS